MLVSFWELYFSILREARFPRSVLIMSFVKLYLNLYLIWDELNSDSRMNDMYILFVMLYSRWPWKAMLCSLSVENMLLFEMRMLSYAMIATISSICLMTSKIFRCTLDELITKFCFSGQMSRVNFVVNLLLITVAVGACSMRRL